MGWLEALRIQVRANRLANFRLHRAMSALSHEAFHAPRTGFFPSLAGTLNHILGVDLYYVAALHREPAMAQCWSAFEPADTLAGLAQRQAASDERLIALVERTEAPELDALIDLDRGSHVQRERFGHVLTHLIHHQVHHRGQAHAMLAGTAIAPPQLDEFLLPSEAHLRVAEMAALGWTEAAVYGA
jgi:uncharacterized damage-inducible protein DinB